MTATIANGIRLEYERFGTPDGIPLLLIHGFGQQSVAWTPEWIEGFTDAGLNVITFDNRDTGLSEKWDGVIPDFSAISRAVRKGREPGAPYTLSEMAADAAALLDAVGIESAHIAGCSMGGMIAQLVALDHPKKVRSLTVIFSTTGDTDLPPSSPEAIAALRSEPPALDRDSVVAHFVKCQRAYCSTGFAIDEAELARCAGQRYDRMYYPEGPLRHWAAILATPPRGERLREIRVPTLVLHGGADTLIPPAHGRRVAERIPGAAYHEIEGWGHDFPRGVMPVLHGLMVPFIEKVERAAQKSESRA